MLKAQFKDKKDPYGFHPTNVEDSKGPNDPIQPSKTKRPPKNKSLALSKKKKKKRKRKEKKRKEEQVTSMLTLGYNNPSYML